MDIPFLYQTLLKLLTGVPLTLHLAVSSVALGAVLAIILALARLSGLRILAWPASCYVFVFRSTPLLVQIFLVYHGLGQFHVVRASFLWPVLREPYWCALIALTLNTAAYSSEIVRGALLSVPPGQIEAARACGMSSFTLYRRIVFPLALRHALPGYGNEFILMIKSTALASIITLMEVTGLATELISESFRAIEILMVAAAIYLFINFTVTRRVQWAEYALSAELRSPPAAAPGKGAPL
ncbi:ABC transporter permease [Mesorhizobium sp. M4A.F.Ca.ET.050.02.1.1]|uniref:ABC transporter permease n=1 Tax=unclassified Mesorhizobium TaxID=325217 RepID=UPI000FCAE6AA|nr:MULTISPECIES: ABC transporter permease [unclassified Mesorhizobium]RUX49439.1 ABC transporter permease [Mesorhizobium sp. M4A.F.Ca.ET.050.02.1.1]RWD29283.1 MAG: ABC transporter permease [Mesorhizobium sp.]TIW24648.1 MAG: ABC transporter permease subunit [Mesorhizobium sp.]